jgi:hypothetical protein
MDRTPVESSMIASIGYDRATQTLELEFKSGAIWQYEGVPQSEYDALMAADSHGSYARSFIIGDYPERSASSKRRR